MRILIFGLLSFLSSCGLVCKQPTIVNVTQPHQTKIVKPVIVPATDQTFPKFSPNEEKAAKYIMQPTADPNKIKDLRKSLKQID